MQPGSVVAGGKYRVDRVIGRGGMGVVVAATHVQLENKVALKFLDAEMAKQPKATARFLREAKACAGLRNENICRVSDFGVENGVPFIVMELLEGVDLQKLARTRTIDVATAANYIRQACSGLAEAHAAKIIHRDLKPGNLFVSRRTDGTEILKILDFGVAKTDPNDPTDAKLTGTAHVVGSPGFMAPEQIRSSRTVDARADVWSLGVILYKLVSGREPWSANGFAEFAMAIVRDDMPPLPEAPPAFEKIVRKCLEKDPDKRYRDVGALSLALEPFATGSHAAKTIVPPAVAPLPRATPMPMPRPTPNPAAAKKQPGTLIDGSGTHRIPTTTNAPTHDLSESPAVSRETLYSQAMATPTVETEDLGPGSIVGEYRIEKKIGQGGMGIVYAAIHPLIGKKAAIKVISAGLGTDVSTMQRFVQEARSVNQIGHPNIVDVFAFGMLPDGRNYFVMEHLQGESLRQRLSKSRLTLGDSLEIVDEIAAALEAAHEKQIVHRDLKPDNIFLASIRGGRIVVKLLDFGIAKLAVADGKPHGTHGIAKTQTGMMMGTPAYLSPEQARGHNVGYPTDIYALGCMLYELACGVLPFVAPSPMDVVLMHIESPPPAPSTIWAEIPPALEGLIMKMLAKDPQHRPTLAQIRGVFADLVIGGVVPIEQGSGTFRSELRARRASEVPSYRTPPTDPPTVRDNSPVRADATPTAVVASAEVGVAAAAAASAAVAASASASAAMTIDRIGVGDAKPQRSRVGIVIAVIAVIVIGVVVAAIVATSKSGASDASGSGSATPNPAGSDGAGSGVGVGVGSGVGNGNGHGIGIGVGSGNGSGGGSGSGSGNGNGSGDSNGVGSGVGIGDSNGVGIGNGSGVGVGSGSSSGSNGGVGAGSGAGGGGSGGGGSSGGSSGSGSSGGGGNSGGGGSGGGGSSGSGGGGSSMTTGTPNPGTPNPGNGSPSSRTVTITADHAKAIISVDGKVAGTHKVVVSLARGAHEIVIAAPNRLTDRRSVVVADKDVVVDVKLHRAAQTQGSGSGSGSQKPVTGDGLMGID